MNELNKIRTIFITVFTVIWAKLGILAIPWMLLLILNIMDYATGISAAPYRLPEDSKPVKSYKSVRGIQKKVCMHLLVVIGCFIDWIIKASLMEVISDFKYPPIFAIAIALWLTFNEIISILENMEDIGTPIPPFLKPIIKMMRKQVDDRMNQIKIQADAGEVANDEIRD